jgi:hypothetical protein
MKITIKEFIDENEKILIVMGVLLAALSISLGQISLLDKTYAGYMSVVGSITLFILITEMIPKDHEEMSFKLILFMGALVSIIIMIFLTIIKTYNSESWQIFTLAIDIIVFSIGLFSIHKLFEFFDKKKHNLVFRIIIFLIFILVLFFFDLFINLFLNLSILFRLNKIINLGLIRIFFVGCGTIIIFWGLGLINKFVKSFLYPLLSKKN